MRFLLPFFKTKEKKQKAKSKKGRLELIMASVEFSRGNADVYGVAQDTPHSFSSSPVWNVEAGDVWTRIEVKGSSVQNQKPLWTVKEVDVRPDIFVAYADLFLDVEAAETQNPYRVHVNAFCRFPRSETPPHTQVKSIMMQEDVFLRRALIRALSSKDSTRDAPEVRALVHPWISSQAKHWPLEEGTDFVTFQDFETDFLFVRLNPQLFDDVPSDVYGFGIDDAQVVLLQRLELSAPTSSTLCCNNWLESSLREKPQDAWHDSVQWTEEFVTLLVDASLVQFDVFAHAFPSWPALDAACLTRLKELEDKDDRVSDEMCERLERWFPLIDH